MEALLNFWNDVKKFFEVCVLDIIKEYFDLKAAFDILLLAIIMYLVYRYVRERRAGKLLIGLVCVLLLSVISESWGLRALDFVFGDFRQLGLIAVLIVFQPELRSLLEKVGGTPMSSAKIFSSDSSKELASRNAEISAICGAVSDLSRDRVGALIVIEQSTNLDEYIKSGVVVDASISPHLLRNLFFNKAPLHDGAVILRKNRICAAGCFLPLSTKEDINKDLGTRHRAAIGLSEVSDAVVIVVSEETGIISLARNGGLERNFNYNSLKQALNPIFEAQGQFEIGKKHSSEKKEAASGKKNDSKK